MKKTDHRYGKLIKKKSTLLLWYRYKKGFEVIHFLSEGLQCITWQITHNDISSSLIQNFLNIIDDHKILFYLTILDIQNGKIKFESFKQFLKSGLWPLKI